MRAPSGFACLWRPLSYDASLYFAAIYFRVFSASALLKKPLGMLGLLGLARPLIAKLAPS